MNAPPASALLLLDVLRSHRQAGLAAATEQLGRWVLIGSLPGSADPWAYRTSRVHVPGSAPDGDLRQVQETLEMQMQVFCVRKGVDRAFKSQVLIGRSDANDVVLAHQSVSKLHARISVTADTPSLEDAGSANGTFVNNALLGGSRHALKNGDRLRFGHVELTFLKTPSLLEMLVARSR